MTHGPCRAGAILRTVAVALAVALSLWAACATAAIPDVASFLDRAESVRLTDHPRFARMLAQIHREAPVLTEAQRWRLRYLDGWESAFRGDYPAAERRLKDVADHSGDVNLAAKAGALLLSVQVLNQRYEEAYRGAAAMIARLPRVTRPDARQYVLHNLSQVLDLAGQPDLALKYARMMRDPLPAGESPCDSLALEIAALENLGKLHSSSPELARTIQACLAAGNLVIADTARLIQVDRLLAEHRPRDALELDDRMAAAIRGTGYYPHLLAIQLQRAQAYLALGNDPAAEKAAMKVVAMSTPGDNSIHLADAYHVLYEIGKKRGRGMQALDYYERYVTQNTRYLNDVSARALAYQRVQQSLLAQKMQYEALARQNQVLRLQEALTEDAARTTRLYALFLLAAMTLLVLWLVRVKRLQLRFRELARRDGLTGILNHQHFMRAAQDAVAEQQRSGGSVALALIDLDHFKLINDTHGHVTGDQALRHIVSVVQGWLRPGDLFGRLGGEEFGLLLSGCGEGECVALAEHVRESIAGTPLRLDGEPIVVTASIGMAFAARIGFDLPRLFHHADAALYAAKRAGRDRVTTELTDDDLPGRSVRDPRPA
ncbi:MAG: GGDEF domain-containing protein [Xanthomonadaceae bacterium]|nr:GGDEF domain-containing protein [Xanthomonadaceae bacterium]MDE1965318.1 GGDEF domain-containing protein [Xanthomonadaceae bacterium]